MSKILIKGFHKASVLQYLYNHAKFQGKYFDNKPIMRVMAANTPDIPFVKVNEYLDSHIGPYHDYVTIDDSIPKPIKVDLSGIEIDITDYDEMHGNGKAQEAIDDLLKFNRYTREVIDAVLHDLDATEELIEHSVTELKNSDSKIISDFIKKSRNLR